MFWSPYILLLPLHPHQSGAGTLHRCWHIACRSTWCTRASHPSSRTSSHAGCPGSSSSRSDRSWWRWGNFWDLREINTWQKRVIKGYIRGYEQLRFICYFTSWGQHFPFNKMQIQVLFRTNCYILLLSLCVYWKKYSDLRLCRATIQFSSPILN